MGPEAQQELTEKSLTDPLTGVGNRALIRNRVEAYFTGDATQRGRFAIALMDLDGFKKVNDSLGHEVGDILLKRTEPAPRDHSTLPRHRCTAGRR
ncbi:GGDEF domain-containing protein [Cupriavidus basilensis]